MARLIPRVVINDIGVTAEREVAQRLFDQLPQTCLVYHSYPWLRAERNDNTGRVTLREGETDFVVVDPEHGILVLEVKGGQIGYDAETRAWTRHEESGRVVPLRDPFAQASRSFHWLRERLEKQVFAGRGGIPCAFGYAVVFPDCVYSGATPPGADPHIVLSAKDLDQFAARLRRALGVWRGDRPAVELTRAEIDDIQQALSPPFQLVPVLFRQIEDQEARLCRMTDEQAHLLDMLALHPRAAVQGVAGSGKTLLALARAQHFADDGQRTLFVCYNKALAAWIRARMPERYESLITVRSFHALCSEVSRRAALPFSPPPGAEAEFWDHGAAELLCEALEITGERFDAVVVDEGQDFDEDWWVPLEMIQRDPVQGGFYVFFDPAQNLFVRDGVRGPDLGTPYVLPRNCRNTRQIVAVCGVVSGLEIAVRDDAPSGTPCALHVCAPGAPQAERAQAVVREWLTTGGLRPAQIAILCAHEQARSSLAGLTEIAGAPLVGDPRAWMAGEGVLFMTVRSFKGLEADAVLLVDVEPDGCNPRFTRTDFYVACSRAKHVLTVLATDESVLEGHGAVRMVRA